MSDLLDIREMLQDTTAMIARVERQVAEHPDMPSLLVNLKAIENRQRQLETEFEAVASRIGLDVCRYRILAEGDRVPLAGLASALVDYQALVSVFYDAVKNGPKQRAKIGAETTAETAFDFGYTSSGSVAFVLTIPNERLLAIESNLDEAVRILSDAVRAQNPDDIRRWACKLGRAAIMTLYRWANGHVQAHLSAEIEWRRGSEIRARILVQWPEFERLTRIIAQTGEEERSELTVTGLLLAIDVARRTFCMDPDVGNGFLRGTFSETIDPGHTVELPRRYKATLTQTQKIRYSTEEPEITYQLKSLEPA